MEIKAVKGDRLFPEFLEGQHALNSRFAQFEEKLEKQKEITVSVDTKPILDIVKKAIEDIELTVAAQPKNTVREFSFHLFPKLNIMEYYRTYSRLLLVLSLFLVVAGLVSIGVKWIEGYNQREKQLPKFNKSRNTPNQTPGLKIKK